jgi:CelD/BcsL family acetyltransferase involved in cellulose biosynthesis
MADLKGEWCELFEHSFAATPFQSWAWLYSWWEHYEAGRELRLIAVRQCELLVGLMPLMLERSFGFGRLLFIGTGITDHLDILVRDGYRDCVIDAVVDALSYMKSWQFIDLHQLRPEAAAWGLALKWSGPKLTIWEDDFPIIEARPLDQILPLLSQNHRSTIRRTLRRAEKDGVESKLASSCEAEQAGRRLVVLHREMWEGRPIAPEHMTMRFLEHLATAAERLTAAGLGGVSEFRRGGRVIISSLLVFGRGYVGTCLQGASRDAVSQYQIGSLYICDALKRASERRLAHVSLLRGAEPYKLRWKPMIVPNRQLILGRSHFTWAPYSGYRFLYSKSKRFAHSDKSPRWGKCLANVYRKLARGYRSDKRLS